MKRLFVRSQLREIVVVVVGRRRDMVDSIKKTWDGWVRGLDERLRDKDFYFATQLDAIEEKTGVKRVNIALGQ